MTLIAPVETVTTPDGFVFFRQPDGTFADAPDLADAEVFGATLDEILEG